MLPLCWIRRCTKRRAYRRYGMGLTSHKTPCLSDLTRKWRLRPLTSDRWRCWHSWGLLCHRRWVRGSNGTFTIRFNHVCYPNWTEIPRFKDWAWSLPPSPRRSRCKVHNCRADSSFAVICSVSSSSSFTSDPRIFPESHACVTAHYRRFTKESKASVLRKNAVWTLGSCHISLGKIRIF